MSAADEIRAANLRYHDLAAPEYDEQWGIAYDDAGVRQVVRKLRKALAGGPQRFGCALEIGAGTGYFGLNLVRAGAIGELVATDLSPGMVAVLRGSADRLGLDVETHACDAAELPFADHSFELVFGHAVLHHLPDLDAAFREFRRVLAPGGLIAFCGEPSRRGDRLARLPKRGARAVAPVWRALVRAGPRRNGASAGERERLQPLVDVHAFTPAELAGHARRAGFSAVRIRGEELVASLFGWTSRALEATAAPDEVPWVWRQYAYRGYLALQAVDRLLLESLLPAGLFYNLLISGRAPGFEAPA